MPEITEQKVRTPRIIALDLLRGYFLISIILNHLQWYPNLLDWVALRGSLVVSAAEGFFIISGILLGIVRGQKLINQPFKVPALLMLSRGMKLYIVSIILMIFFTFVGWLFLSNTGLKPGIRPIDQPLNEIIFGALNLSYIYGWADFLRLYAIFLIMSPFALWLLRKGKWYFVILASCAIWCIFPVASNYTHNSGELLMPFSWQLIFFVGLTIGFHWVDISNWWKNKPAKIRRLVITPVLTIAATTLLINVAFVVLFDLGLLQSNLQAAYNNLLLTTFNKEALTIPRLALFGLWFTLGLYIFMRYEKHITKWFGWILLPFGINSLYVYILHAIIIFFAHLLIPPASSTNIFINVIGTAAILGVILLAAKKRFLFNIIPR